MKTYQDKKPTYDIKTKGGNYITLCGVRRVEDDGAWLYIWQHDLLTPYMVHKSNISSIKVF